jgi:cysteine desulfurase / selenocysteine lyase
MQVVLQMQSNILSKISLNESAGEYFFFASPQPSSYYYINFNPRHSLQSTLQQLLTAPMFLATEQHWAKLFPDEVLGKAKTIFPHTHDGKIYLDHAASSPLSIRVVESIEAHLRERCIGSIDTYLEHDVAKIEKCRGRIKELLNAESADRIAFMANTSDPINVIASGLKWASGDRILLHESEFPANVWPYLNLKRHGVEIDVIPIRNGHPTPQLIADSITERTKVVAISAVQFLTGYRADLEAIGSLCRSKNVLLVVDGIQAVGSVKVDVQRMKIDAMASGCQKWQMGPHGTGWLYISENLQARIKPAHVGWLSVEEPWNFFDYNQQLHPTARRFEGGSKNIPGIWGLDAALATLLEFGLDGIEGHILALTQMLISGLQSIDGVHVITPTGHNQRAGIVTIELPNHEDPKVVHQHLKKNDISVALRDGKIRYSPHFYNSPTEIALAVAATREAVAQ